VTAQAKLDAEKAISDNTSEFKYAAAAKLAEATAQIRTLREVRRKLK